MAGGSIKLFAFYKKYNQVIGTDSSPPPNQNHQHQTLDAAKPIIVAICLGQFFISTAAFVLFEAKTIYDYGITFFAILSMILTIFTYLIPFVQMRRILKFIENCEKFIEKSEKSF